MSDHGILVADKDTKFLRQIADFFTTEGYQVETTNSAVHVICNILKKQTPVVVLGSDFDSRINLLQLLQLLKKCKRHLAVIMVSDEASLPMERSIRNEGIFYHALRPVTADDHEEIKQAVECALTTLQTAEDDGVLPSNALLQKKRG